MAASGGQWRVKFTCRSTINPDVRLDIDKTIDIIRSIEPNQDYGPGNLYYNYDSGPVIFALRGKNGWVIDDIIVEDFIDVEYQMLDDDRIEITPTIASYESGEITVFINMSQPPAYLDRAGLAYLWAKCKIELAKKVDKTGGEAPPADDDIGPS